MPEEINRVVTDRLSDLLFLPSRDAAENLEAEGIPTDRMHFVGNVMIDTLCWALPQALAVDAPMRFDVRGRPYVVVTLHRPANVDDPTVLQELLEALTRLADHVPVLFPVHPRTRARIERDGKGLYVGNGFQEAFTRGLTVEGMGLRTGDRIIVPRRNDTERTFRILGILVSIPVAIIGIAALSH